jgi:hypothetical protein
MNNPSLLLRFILGCYVFVSTIFAFGQSANTSNYAVSFPLKASANSRYLVDQKDKPFPIMGRTAWFMISQSVADYKYFLDNTLAKGYNSIEMSMISHDPRGSHPPFNGDNDLPFLKQLNGSPWNGSLVYKDIETEAPDLTTPNEKYWKYLDEFLLYCESKGILVFAFPAYVGYVGTDQGWMEDLIANSQKRCETYGAWVANRYKNHKNIVWMLLGDMGYYTISQRNVEAALIRGLKSVAGQQSIFYSSEASAGQNSSDAKDFGKDINLNGTYDWGYRSIAALGRRAYAYEPTTPAFLLEEPYDEEGPDGNSVNPNAIQPVRRYQWWGWLCTIGGYIAGNGYIWPFVDPWKKHLDTPGAIDMQHLNGFIRSIHWWELVPSGLGGMRNLILSGGGSDTSANFVASAANLSGSLLVAYLPPTHDKTITVNTSGMSKQLSASWFDPTNGSYTTIKGSPFTNTGELKFTQESTNSRGEKDWVLVISSAKQ